MLNHLKESNMKKIAIPEQGWTKKMIENELKKVTDPDKRFELMEAMCMTSQEQSYTREPTDEELQSMKDELAEAAVELAEIKIEEAEFKNDFKKKKKPLETKIDKIVHEIGEGEITIEATVFKFVDYKSKRTYEVDEHGVFVADRPSFPDELQKNLWGAQDGKAEAGQEAPEDDEPDDTLPM